MDLTKYPLDEREMPGPIKLEDPIREHFTMVKHHIGIIDYEFRTQD